MDAAIRVIIADDQVLFRRFLAGVLASDDHFRVVAEGANGEEAVALVRKHRPDLLIVDLKMPVLGGIEVARAVLGSVRSTRVVILTGFGESAPAIEAISSGVAGYIVKDVEPETLIHALLAVAGNEHVISSSLIDPVIQTLSQGEVSKRSHDGLSERELQVLRLAASGLANKEIAKALDITQKTVRNHVNQIHVKLGIHDRSQAVLYAVRKGLVDTAMAAAG